MKGLCLFFSLIISSLFDKSYAAEGCLIGTSLYTLEATPAANVNIASDLIVYRSPATDGSCIIGSSSGAKACFACVSGGRVMLVVGATPLLYVVTCEGGLLGYPATRGTYYSSYIIQCNLDDYSWAFVIASGVFGFVFVRKTKTQV
ncbi:hypothetical protein [Pedobacter sp. Leaf170]|uniref:hypothetical protein n=1 Tax=Pedobacter sp. Leaf170 TaxID=2876558 RepID=UPI001E52306E|nr:hypothetical protein [Pedobacter sp. Leaf170]